MAEWTWKINSNGIWYKLVVREASQSIDDNKTTLNWFVYAWNTTASWFSYSQNNVIKVRINGVYVYSTENYGTISLQYNMAESGATLLCSGQTAVTHKADGSKTCNIYLYATQNWQNAWIWEKEDNIALTPIARASQPTLSVTSVDFGGTVTINTNPAVSSFRHTLRYSFCTKTGTIATDVEGSAAWTAPASLMSEIPSDTKSWATIYCDTYSGDTLIGTKSVTIDLIVPVSIVPALAVSVSEAASIPSALSGMYIQSRSRLKVISTGTGQYGASIKSYLVTVEDKDYSGSEVTTGYISGSGTVDIKVSVTDSRGRTTTKTVSISVTAYSPPRLTGISAYRCASSTSTVANKDGAYICVKPKGSIAALGNKNAKTCTVCYKKSSATSYTSKALTMSDYILDTEYVIFPADMAYGYDIYVVLQDSITYAKAFAASVMSAAAFIDALLDEATETEIVGMSIGKQAEVEGAADFGWDMILRKGLDWKGCSITSFTPTVNIDATYYGCIGTYVIIGKLAFVELVIQIDTLNTSVSGDIIITLPAALKMTSRTHPSQLICATTGSNVRGYIRPVSGNNEIKSIPIGTVGSGTYLAYGVYVFMIQ